MISRCLITIAFFLAAPSLARSSQETALPAVPELNLALFPARVQEQSKQAYDNALGNPMDASASGKLGMLLHAYNFTMEAEVCYRRAHQLDPKSFDWLYYLGLAQAEQGKFEEATAVLRQAVGQNPHYLPAELHLGECLLASGKWHEAEQFYLDMVARYPERAEAYYGLGRVKAIRNDLKGAVDSFVRACNDFPNFGPAHYALAQAYRRLGKSDQALEQLALYEKNTTLAPAAEDKILENVNALNEASEDQLAPGAELAREGRLEEASAALDKVLEKNPRLVEAHIKLIEIYALLHQPQKAEEHFQEAVHLDPQNPESYFNRGLLFASKEDFVEAEAAFRKVLEINPRYPGAQLNLGSMLEAQGKPQEAIAEYQKVLDKNSEDASAHFSLGRILVNKENYKEGIEHLERAIKGAAEDSQPTYLYALGAAYARSADIENAQHYLRLARQKALARGQSKLAESIDADLRDLEAAGSPK